MMILPTPKDDVAANDDENAMSDDSCDMNKEWNNDHESFANINKQFMAIKTSIFFKIIW